MTATTSGWADATAPTLAPAPDPGFDAPPLPEGERGRTTIGAGVVSTVAARAAAAVPGVLRSEPSGLARMLRARTNGLPGASAEVQEGRAHVQLQVTVAYPHPVWSTADEIRERVRQQVLALTGLETAEVDLDVHLARRTTPHRRVV